MENKLRWMMVAAAALLMSGSVAAAGEDPRSVDLLIRGGDVVDGTGGPRVRADVAVNDGHIVAVGTDLALVPKSSIDATGMVVSPGFIDPHNHSPSQLIEPALHLDETFIRQGVTTVVGGPDGELSPGDMHKLLALYRKTGIGPNVAFYVGHNAIRMEVLGSSQDRAPSAGELEQMRALVREGMQAGAVGFSTGLMYSPGLFSETDEVIALAKEAAPFHGIYESHVRDPHRALLQSNWEAIEIGRQAGLPVDLTHLTTPGKDHRGLMKAVIEQIEAARRSGMTVVADQYPYNAVAVTMLRKMLRYPDPSNASASGNGPADLAKVKLMLGDAAQKALIRRETLTGGIEGYSGFKASGPSSILILVCKGCERYEGRFLSEIAAEKQLDGFDAAADLLLNAQEDIVVSQGGFFEEDVLALIKQPWAMIASDGSIPGTRFFPSAHPRFTGTFPRVLGHYVRDLHVIALEEAVRRMTSAPADFLGLKGRGRLAAGAAADIVVFDPATIDGRSTWKDPMTPPVGVADVIVNGVLVLRDGVMTGKAPGQYLKRGGGLESLAPPGAAVR